MAARPEPQIPHAVSASIWRALIELVDEQAGVASAHQLEVLGLSRRAVWSQVRARRWRQVHRGVFALFTGPLPREAVIWAAILRCGDGATASHETAAELHGLADVDPDGIVHVTIPANRRVRGHYDGIVVHHAHRLATTRHPSRSPPLTRVEATVLDLVDVARSPRVAEAWVLVACQRRKTTPSRLAAALATRKKIRWRSMTEAMVLDASYGAESPLEAEHLRAVVRAHGLPEGMRQRRIAGSRVIWVDEEHSEFDLRVELDGRVGHEGEGAFRDRRRDNAGVVGGKATLRYGHAEVFGDPCGVASEQVEVMQARGWKGLPIRCGPDCSVR